MVGIDCRFELSSMRQRDLISSPQQMNGSTFKTAGKPVVEF
jgi:hypothetical protein